MIVEAVVVVGSIALAYEFYASIVAKIKVEIRFVETELKAELAAVEARITTAVKSGLGKL
jgi:hypothetical protein